MGLKEHLGACFLSDNSLAEQRLKRGTEIIPSNMSRLVDQALWTISNNCARQHLVAVTFLRCRAGAGRAELAISLGSSFGP